jgi:PilZ domain
LGTRERGAIDSPCQPFDYISMVAPDVQTGSTRRSSRVFTRIPVRAQGKNSQGRSFKRSSQTIVINAHGGLLYLQEEVAMGTELVLVNPATEEEQDCRVVYIGDTSDKGTRIGVEFLSPSPHFWGIEFAQQDWPSRGSSTPVH